MFLEGFSKSAKVRVIKTLGRGGEGIAQLVDHPKFGRVVRKTFNITSKQFSKPLFDKKLEILKKVKSPYLSKFYGQEGNKPITYSEYVPFKKEVGRVTPERMKVIRGLEKKTRAETGTGIKDLAGDNLVRTKGGGLKAIDFLIDGPLSQTSRKGKLKKAMKQGGRPAMARLLDRFDRKTIEHKSNEEVLKNANQPKSVRDSLIRKATHVS